MVLKKFADGNVLYGSEVNSLYAENFTIQGLNAIRQAILGSPTFEYTTYDIFVSSATLTATDEDISGDATYDPDGWTNPTYAFDRNISTYADAPLMTSGQTTRMLGKTFTSRTVYSIRAKTFQHIISGAGGEPNTGTLTLQKYDGANWTDETILVTQTITGVSQPLDITYNGVYIPASPLTSCQGIRLKFTRTIDGAFNQNNEYIYELNYGLPLVTTGAYAITSGQFNSTISNAIGVPMMNLFYTGDDVQFKLTNATEDSGYMTSLPAVVSTFTAFTSQPTYVTVKLIPKAGGILGSPVIKGFAVRSS